MYGQIDPCALGYTPQYIRELHIKQLLTPAQIAALPKPMGVILYETGTQTFYYVEPKYKCLVKQGNDWFIPAAQHLAQANAHPPQNEQQASHFAQLKSYFNNIIQPVVQGPGQNELCELLSFTTNAWLYMKQAHFNNITKTAFCVATEAAQAMVMDGGVFSAPLLLKKLVGDGSIKYEPKIQGAITPLANALGVDPVKIHKVFFGNPKDPDAHLVATKDVQLMRYSAGASITGSFNPNSPQFGFSTDATAKLTLASGSLEVDCYMPCHAGYHAHLSTKTRAGRRDLIDMGYFRAEGKLKVDGFVGASIEGSVALDCGMSKEGKLLVRGKNVTRSNNNVDAANYGIPMAVDALAGAKLGGDVSLACQWKNPEKGFDWDPFASIGADGDIAAGVGADASFKITYNTNEGKFVIHTEAGLVCGIGASGSLTVVVYPEHVVSFVAFCYHRIMENDYAYTNLIEDAAFSVLVNLWTKFVLSEAALLENVFETAFNKLQSWWTNTRLGFDSGDPQLDQAMQIADNINSNPAQYLKWTLPEVKGRLLYILSDPALPKAIIANAPTGAQTQAMKNPFGSGYVGQAAINVYASTQLFSLETAILNILSYIQSEDDYDQVMRHLSLDAITPQPKAEGEERLYNFLPHDADTISRLQKFHMKLTNGELEYGIRPNSYQPVKPNEQIIQIRNGK